MSAAEVKVVLIGDIALNHDITPRGQKISPGGAAYYSMVGAACFSEKVGMVGKIGTDFNPQLFSRRKIDVSGVKVADGDSCRFVITQHADGTRDFEARRNVADKVDTTIFPKEYLAAKYMHLATQLPAHALVWQEFLKGCSCVTADTFEAFIRLYPEMTLLMLERANMIFINQAEFDSLGISVDSYRDRPVIHKLGKDGVVYRSPTESFSIPAPKVTALETTGAGDVLAGAFLALLSLGYKTYDALTQAVNLASQSVTNFGVEHLKTK